MGRVYQTSLISIESNKALGQGGRDFSSLKICNTALFLRLVIGSSSDVFKGQIILPLSGLLLFGVRSIFIIETGVSAISIQPSGFDDRS